MPIRPRFCCFTVFFNCLVHNMALKSRMSMKRAVFVYFNFWFGIIKVVTERPEAWIQGDHLSIKILFYQHRDSHYKDKMVSQPSYVCNEKFHPSIVFTLRRGPRSLMGLLSCVHTRLHGLMDGAGQPNATSAWFLLGSLIPNRSKCF